MRIPKKSQTNKQTKKQARDQKQSYRNLLKNYQLLVH